MSSKPDSKKQNTNMKAAPNLIEEIDLPGKSNENNVHQDLNPFTEIKQASHKLGFKNQTQFIPNSTDKNPFHDKNISGENKNGVIKIKLFKSTIKPYRPMNPEEKENSANLELLKKKPIIKVEESDKIPLIVEQINDKNNQYKYLIKKIAMQLKKKIRPRTKGFFYMNVIRNERYLNLVKKIAQSIKNKVGTHPPTNGPFYSYMKKEEEIKMKKEKEEKYKSLIKKISSQLKKRVKFPKCKIIKIYESYRTLIKRIADALKKSMKNSCQNETQIQDNAMKNENNEEIKDDKAIVIEKSCCVNKENSEEIKNEIVMDIDTPFGANNENKEEIKNEKVLDLDSGVNVKVEKNDNDVNNIIEDKNTENKIDIEMKDETETPQNPFLYQGIQTEIKKETNENNDMKTLTYNQKPSWISSKKKSEDNQVSNYTFSKMEVIDNEIRNSTEEKRPLIILKDSEENKNENPKKNEMPELIINSDEIVLDAKKEEVINCEGNENIIESKDKENINEKRIVSEIKNSKLHKDSVRSGKSLPNPAKSKSLFFDISLMKKQGEFNLGQERKKANKSHSRININLNLENLNNIYNNISNIEKKDIKENNLSLQDIETTKSNFINQFEKFLEQENIEIINNFPVSTNERNIMLFHQSNFWYLVMTYLFYKNNNLSLYNILYLFEQYNIWAQDKTYEIFCSLKERIKEYITSHNSKEALDQFLFMNKLENLDKIFAKFESPGVFPEKDKNKNDFKEIKIEDICYLCDEQERECKCELCTNDNACIQKVCDLNKSRMEIVNNPSMDILKKEITTEELIKRNNDKVVFHNNEELFYKGKSKKKENSIFSKSKTILENGGNLEYIGIQIQTPQIIEKEEKQEKELEKENVENNVDINEKENKSLNIEDKKGIIEIDENKDDFSLENSSEKTFKNISKSEKKLKEEKEMDEKAMSEGKEPNEPKEENENIDDESKIQKKEKKSRKGKSRKKNNNKKKESISKNEGKDFEKDENDEQKEEVKKDKSVKKKRKSTNRSSLKKNKSKNCAKNEETEEKEEKEETYESEDVNLLIRSANKLEEDSSINNSKRKKSKTPNKKKSRKH